MCSYTSCRKSVHINPIIIHFCRYQDRLQLPRAPGGRGLPNIAWQTRVIDLSSSFSVLICLTFSVFLWCCLATQLVRWFNSGRGSLLFFWIKILYPSCNEKLDRLSWEKLAMDEYYGGGRPVLPPRDELVGQDLIRHRQQLGQEVGPV